MSAGAKDSPDVTFDPRTPIDPSRALVPSVVKLNEERVNRGFWPKIRRTVAKVPFAAEALSVWYCAKDDETPTAAKGMMLAALAYFVLPTDVIPDFIAGLGYTDDAAVFAALMTIVGKNLKPRHRQAAKKAVLRLRDS
ncbi:YkvA family protein [Phenylobacterium sp. J367]|uniref:YkvA family protein n=1 Tax=Phenylobacterium sp. J367 TaxID=2898435 RepID=UPI0021514AC4|nr:YkvA family protein [Phenylobacterium sp. J367]MCR5878069.1 DUF1232 domain-containing protein [Phenylobacterium sp. J367]